VRLPDSRRRELFDGGAGVFLVQQKPIEGSGWQLTVFSSTAQARGLALNHAALAALAAAFVLVLVAVGKVRRRHIRERLAAREALQRAHDELEKKVEQRTEELSATVAQLQAEVAERTRAEASLRSTQAELVQAGKLAVIGQLSAGITHELNQPLAALRTLSGNTLKFLDRGRLDTVRSNLQTIDQMAERMGHITGELKRFARKSTGQQQAVAIRGAIANALFLMEQRIRRDRVEICMNLGEEELRARCDQNRLEQVLVNLIGNAVDAVGELAQGARRVELNARRDGDQVVLQVADNGPGLPQQVRERLFEPFLTTKAPGVGLGLGLTISASIVREFG
jgi:two-component system C4-dicarboxylate transport sensor histidine kinase DctB